MKIIENKWFQIGFVTVLTFVSLGAGSQLAQGKTGLALIAGFLWIGYVIYFIFKKA
jgi:hypothetical protein